LSTTEQLWIDRVGREKRGLSGIHGSDVEQTGLAAEVELEPGTIAPRVKSSKLKVS